MKTNKIVTIGDSRTGKTSILSRFMSNVFDPTHTTSVGIDWFSKTVFFTEDGQQRETKLFLWDTSGQERFKALTPSYVKDARVVLLVFDLNEPESLQQVVFWFQQAQKAQTNCTYILVGNKCDLERKCTAAEIDQVKIQCQSDKYYEVSAKDGTNIQTLFTDIGKELYKMNKQEEDDVQPVYIKPEEAKSKRGFCC
ncbi:Rab1a [Hexamita inflata]|uniref:Rab1a n=2 Tax=Hexamita inflata TaxID=28002 RepID=A0AA86PJ73_9EUKA|nr:Rab1a [Hexamita inflata]CAI9966171.1 Rab1a [Hexamita inflata]